MSEVETQIRWRNNRASLLHMRAENFAQRSVHQVSRSVVTSRRVPFLNVNLSRHHIANLQATLLNFDFMHDQTLRRWIRIVHQGVRLSWPNQHTDIPNLTTTLRIERRTIQDDFAFVTFIQRLNFVAFDQRNNLRIIDSRGFITLEDRLF